MAYQGGKLANGTPLNVAVYNAYVNAGLSHNQALAVTAEVGRENSFNANVLFGNHTDPAANSNGKKIRNLGMLSWNQGRDNMLEGYLNKNGVMSNGVMQKTQANLDAQAKFSVREMKSKRYAGKLKNFLNNPNASPDSYAADLGKHYIAWAYGQDDIKAEGGGRKAFDWKANDNRRRGYLNTLSGMLGGNTNYQAQSNDTSWNEPQWESQAWQAPSWQDTEQNQWQEPQWQENEQASGFVEPQWQDAEPQEQSSFVEPEWQSIDSAQVGTAPVRDLTDSEPSAWQPPQWDTPEQELPISAMQPRQI